MSVSVDLSHFKPLDPGRIHALDPVELKYWCEQLHCTETELHEVIAEVGDHVTVSLSAGRIVDGVVKAVMNRVDGVRLQVDYGKDETALAYLWQVRPG